MRRAIAFLLCAVMLLARGMAFTARMRRRQLHGYWTIWKHTDNTDNKEDTP